MSKKEICAVWLAALLVWWAHEHRQRTIEAQAVILSNPVTIGSVGLVKDPSGLAIITVDSGDGFPDSLVDARLMAIANRFVLAGDTLKLPPGVFVWSMEIDR